MKERIKIFGIEIDSVSVEKAVNKTFCWIQAGDLACRYVVTPNIDHLVRIQKNEQFKEAYRGASLVLLDSRPAFLALRALGKSLPEVVPGSDFVPALFKEAQKRGGLKVFWLGAAPGVAIKAAERIQKQYPLIRTVGFYSPAQGFEYSREETEKIISTIAENAPDLLIVGLGAPKQELWVYAHQRQINAKVAICAGATIDFLAGEKTRSLMDAKSLP
jgi:N-acetylglucosaminyldiphosphoundecaprenol N-acetyl-beta-D-mannosaminyltransferase